MRILMLAATALAALLAAQSAFAHGGGLDAQGCHHNRSTGEYHCHRRSGLDTGAMTRKPMIAPALQQDGCSCGSGKICIGPRGGRYCITASGTKRYGQ